jgi:two-component system response regulator AtoC
MTQPTNHERTVLICEEAPEVGNCLDMAVKSLGYSIQSARDGDEVLSFLQYSRVEFSLLLLDLVVPSRSGRDIVREIRVADAELPVIVVSASSSTPDVVAAMKSGATDFLSKPLAREDLARILSAAPETGNTVCKSAPRNTSGTFRSANQSIMELESLVAQVGWSGAPVLIQGETGSGKEVLARRLHAQSTRAHKPFLKLNCAALPSELVESELFGYERGAFTGAFEKKAGIFELADGGTILLDEIGDMDVRLQAKLLQVLQDQEFRRIGGRETVKVSVRIMAATHRDLEKAIQDGSFREDLYYRLNVVVLQVPPLRERTEDIVPLGDFLIGRHADEGSRLAGIDLDLGQAMINYNWPGNVRELENYMRRLLIFGDSDAIARDLRARMSRKSPAEDRPRKNHVAPIGRGNGISALEQVTKVNQQAEVVAILAALDSTHWNRKQAATILKVDYKSLLYKLKKLGIDDHVVLISKQSTPVPIEAQTPGNSGAASRADVDISDSGE